jgi:hypothetical protein
MRIRDSRVPAFGPTALQAAVEIHRIERGHNILACFESPCDNGFIVTTCANSQTEICIKSLTSAAEYRSHFNRNTGRGSSSNFSPRTAAGEGPGRRVPRLSRGPEPSAGLRRGRRVALSVSKLATMAERCLDKIAQRRRITMKLADLRNQVIPQLGFCMSSRPPARWSILYRLASVEQAQAACYGAHQIEGENRCAT